MIFFKDSDVFCVVQATCNEEKNVVFSSGSFNCNKTSQSNTAY